jgi:O-antigen/teichoic acid export membrane protein
MVRSSVQQLLGGRPDGRAAWVFRAIGGLSSFSVLHPVNAILSAVYGIALLVALSRTLGSARYAEVVFLTSLGLYFQPIDQALGRANFINLRECIPANRASGRDAVLIALCTQAALLTIAALVLPAVLIPSSLAVYRENAGYLLFALLITYWSFDLQSAAFALGITTFFARVSVAHRFWQFSALLALWITGSLSVFVTLALLGMALFIAILIQRFGRSPHLTLRIGPGTWRNIDWPGQARLLQTSLLYSLADLLVLTSPYAVFAVAFGVGPTLVILDTIMKIARVTMSGCRTLSELALPRQSRMLANDDAKAAGQLYHMITAMCFAASALAAIALMVAGPRIFALLLGPNNVIPQTLAPAAAIVVLATGLYQPAVLLMGYANTRAAIFQLSGVGLLGFLIFAGIVIWRKPDPVPAIWMFTGFIGIASLAAAFLGTRRFALRW